uniref:Uncharacterized protein n=1 Tax=Avena sativa TaxID=4498 RepID=A0ACD5U5A4_AVESA
MAMAPRAVLLLALVAVASATYCPPPPAPVPATRFGSCPQNALKLHVCANVLGLVKAKIGVLPTEPCCSLLDGLVELDAAVCLCTAIKANVLGIHLNVPIDLTLILNNCGKICPADFQCIH